MVLDQQQEVIDAFEQLVGVNIKRERQVGILAELGGHGLDALTAPAVHGVRPGAGDQEDRDDRNRGAAVGNTEAASAAGDQPGSV